MSNADIAFLSGQLRTLATDTLSKESPLFRADVLIREALRLRAFDDVRLAEFRHIYATGRASHHTTAHALAWLASNAERVSIPYTDLPMPDILKSMAGSTLPTREVMAPHLMAIADLLDHLATPPMDDPLTHAVLVESGYRTYLKQLFPDATKPLPGPELAAALFKLIGLAPSEFWKMDKRQRIPFLKQAIAAKKLSEQPKPSPSQSSTPKRRGRPPKASGASIDARMYDYWRQNPESAHWPSRRWAELLGCAKSAIEATNSWKMFIGTREASRKTRKSRTINRDESCDEN